jgi:hypothetical protein
MTIAGGEDLILGTQQHTERAQNTFFVIDQQNLWFINHKSTPAVRV